MTKHHDLSAERSARSARRSGLNQRRRATQVIGLIVGVGLMLLGVAEFIYRIDQPGPLLFWLPTLWGGGGLVLLGVFGPRRRAGLRPLLVTLGAVLGALPTVWTVVMPALSIMLVVLVVKEDGP